MTYKLNLVIWKLLLSEIFASFFDSDDFDDDFFVNRFDLGLWGAVHDFVGFFPLLDDWLFLGDDVGDDFEEVFLDLYGLCLEAERLVEAIVDGEEKLELVLVWKLLDEALFIHN